MNNVQKILEEMESIRRDYYRQMNLLEKTKEILTDHAVNGNMDEVLNVVEQIKEIQWTIDFCKEQFSESISRLKAEVESLVLE